MDHNLLDITRAGRTVETCHETLPLAMLHTEHTHLLESQPTHTLGVISVSCFVGKICRFLLFVIKIVLLHNAGLRADLEFC